MIDPWDDGTISRAGFVVTGAGLRVPVAAPGPLAGLRQSGAAATTAPADAPYRGVGPKGYRRSDSRVREQVCERLLLDPYLDASRIAVRVTKGRVSLSGRVATERMRSAAIAAAESIGAGAVDDALAVDAPRPARPSRPPGKGRRTRRAASTAGGGRR
jgi:hypothetical protein